MQLQRLHPRFSLMPALFFCQIMHSALFFRFLLSPLSLFSLFSFRFLRMMKSSATPTVTKITGEPIENSFLTSSFFSRGDLTGGIVPACTVGIGNFFWRQYKTIQYRKQPRVTDLSKITDDTISKRDSSTHCHHSPVLQTGSSGCHSRRCYRLSSLAHTKWPLEALPGTHL